MEIYAYTFIAGQKAEEQKIERLVRLKKTDASSAKNDEKAKKQDNRQKVQNTADEKNAARMAGINLSAVSFIKPLRGGVTSSYFGDTVSRTAVHLGHDWAVGRGTEIFSSAAGVVEKAYYSESYGYNVLIYHGDGIETRYAHLSALNVVQGEYVEQNQIVGWSGNTGDSTGPHLHFEVIKRGVHVDPLKYIK